jgi:opacity protein-like surface antigen
MKIELRHLQAAAVAFTLFALAAPASAQYYQRDNAFRFRAGLFEPEGNSEYWDDTEVSFSGEAADLEDLILGFDYLRGLGGGGRISLQVSVAGFEGQDDRQDLFFEDEAGFPIVHTATLTVASFTAGLNLNLIPHGPIQPYVGAGGGYYVWELEENGDFVFSGPVFDEIFTELFADEGATIGYYFLAGVAVPITDGWSVFAEGRWHRAEDELGSDFEGFGDLDLSGREISAGFSWSF